MRTTLLVGLAVALLAGGTVLLGWWALPVVGLVWGALGYRGRHPGVLAALAGALAWGGLLIFVAVRVGTSDVASITGGALGVSAPGVYALTVGFAALLTGSAAAVGRALRGLTGSRPAGSVSS